MSLKNRNSSIRAVSWNISAINNNPFEYWTFFPDQSYEDLMKNLQILIENPEDDLEIHNIFHDSMFDELVEEMTAQNISGMEELRKYWEREYRNRKAIQGFLKDKLIGTKRLASMPDRITNTINLQDGGVCHRPTAINAYSGDTLSSLSSWWVQWKAFMFHRRVQIYSRNSSSQSGSDSRILVCNLIAPILRGKYPAITEDEQAISVPLQILCLGILDAIFIYMLNKIGKLNWENIRSSLCNALIHGKLSRLCRIIADSYTDRDVIFIQEAAAVFEQEIKRIEALGEKYAVLAPRVLDGKRDQNSFVLVNKNTFNESSAVDVTQSVLDNLGGTWLAAGDLLVVSLETSHSDARWLLASFHGDSEGLSTQPLVLALMELASREFDDHILLIGMDANTRSGGDCSFQQTVAGFAEFLHQQELVSIWGLEPVPSLWTTCSSRTFLQTQLNKAVPYHERFSRAQRHLKDWIIACDRQVHRVSDAKRDNTGKKMFQDGTVLPTIEFPSDHVIISSTFHVRSFETSVISRPVSVESRVKNRNGEGFSRTPSRSKGANEKTLYDYWGIGAKPLASDVCFNALEQPVSRIERGPISSGSFNRGDDVMCFLEEHFVHMACGRPWNRLDSIKQYYSKTGDRSIWILFSTRPISMALRHLWVRFVFFLAGTAYLVDGIMNITVWMRSSGMFQFIRFAVKPPINSSMQLGIDELGVLRRGCPVTDSLGGVIRGNSTLTTFFRNTVMMEGWWIKTAHEGLFLSFPREFDISRSLDGLNWNAVTRPPWMVSMGTIPTVKDAQLAVDTRAPATWFLSHCVAIFYFAASTYIACVFGTVRRGREGALAMAAGFFGMALMQFCWALNSLVIFVSDVYLRGQESIFVSRSMLVTNFIFFAVNLLLSWMSYVEKYALESYFFGFFAMGIILLFFSSTTSGRFEIESVLVLLFTFVPALVLFVLMIVRHQTSRWVLSHLVADDRRTYDSIWLQIQSRDVNLRAIASLEITVGELCAATGSVILRQTRSAPARGLQPRTDSKRFINSCASPRSVHYSPNFTSLDQLMDQARILNVYLKRKVRDIAQICNGLFLAEIREGGRCKRKFLKFRDDTTESVVWIFADVKPHERALEKLIRSYDCDVSRLIDCCRQTIVFESVSDVQACLNALKTDREIELVRVKNRMSNRADTRTNGGFRCFPLRRLQPFKFNFSFRRHIVLNLRVKSMDTIRLAVDNHICEIQLILEDFANLLTDEMRDRYRVVRNCRDGPSLWRDVGYLIPRFMKGNFVSSARNCQSCQCLQNPPLAATGHHLYVQNAGNVEHGLSSGSACASQSVVHDCRLVFTTAIDSEIGQQMSEGPASLVSTAVPEILSQENQLQNDISNFLKDHFRESSTSCTRYESDLRFGTFRSTRIFEYATSRSTNGSVWDSSCPFSLFICSSWLLKVVVAILLGFLVSLIADLNLIWRNNVVLGRRFRFTALELRNGSRLHLQLPFIQSFGLTKQGCSCCGDVDNISQIMENNTLTLTFPYNVEINGWWFVTGDSAPDSDPVRFILERSIEERGDDWVLTGASSYWWTWCGLVVWDTGYFQTPTLRNVTQEFDLGVPAVWAVHRLACVLCLLIMVLVEALAILLKFHRKSKWIIVGFLFLNSIFNGIACVVYFCFGQWRIAFVAGCFFFVDLVFPVVLATSEKYVRVWFGFAGFLYIAIILIHNLVFFREPRLIYNEDGHFLAIVRNFGLIQGFIAILFYCWATAVLTRLKAEARRVIQVDLMVFDDCWSTLNNNEFNRHVLREMYDYICSVCESLPLVVRQSLGHRESSDEVDQTLAGRGLSDRVSRALRDVSQLSPIQEVEQLFAQSACLDIFLRDKLKTWALGCGGCFQTMNGEFETWERIREAGGESSVMWAPKKSLERACEKLITCYGMDPSLLLDCCRQSIYFHDPARLFECLRLILADEQVSVWRVCNRLHDSYDVLRTAGYRNVRLNLSIESEDTRRLCVEATIGEVQLSLIPLVASKTEASHARYIRWRNQRGR